MKILYIGAVNLLLFLTFYSCVKQVDYPYISKSRNITLNGFCTNDSLTMSVIVVKNPFEIENYKTPITNINLYQKNKVFSFMTHGSSTVYKNKFESDSLHIVCITDSNEILKASTYLPKKPPISTLNRKDSSLKIPEGINDVVLEMGFDDDPDQKNYYEFYSISRFFNYRNNLSAEFQDANIINGTLTQKKANLISGQNFVLFSDSALNGKTINLVFNGFLFITKSNSNVELINDSFQVTAVLRNASKEYYDYKKSLARYKLNNNQDLFSGPSVPAQLYSNVKNGYGVFAGYSSSYKTITVIYNE